MTCVRVCLAAYFFILVVACTPDKPRGKQLRSLSGSDTFRAGERLRNGGKFKEALHWFDSALMADPANTDYPKFNIALISLLAGDSTPAQSFGDELYTQLIDGIEATNDGRDGLIELYEVCTKLRSRNKLDSFEYFVALQSLARCHRFGKYRMDSAQYYSRKLVTFSRSYPELHPHLPVLLVDLVEITMANRDAVTALAYCEEGLRLASDPYVVSELITLKGTLFRKMKLPDSAAYFYKAADSILSGLPTTRHTGKLLRERALNAIINGNDSTFRYIIDQLNQLDVKYSRNGHVNVSRLLGYYYLDKGDARQSIANYEEALRELKTEKLRDPVQVMEAYHAITVQYAVLDDYEKAEQCIYEGMVYLTSFEDKPRSWDHLFSQEIAGEAFNFFNYGLMADVYLGKFKKDPARKSDLIRSLQLYRLVDSLALEQVRVVEENAVIQFLSEGHKLYTGGIEACYELYRSSSDSTYLDQAHRFMERSKALMMYRDVLIRQQQYFPEVPGEFKELELQLKARIAAQKKRLSFTSKEMSDNLRRIDEYYEEMSSKYPEYYKAKYKLEITPFKEVTAMAEKMQRSIIQYHWSNDNLYFLKYDQPVKFERIRTDSTLGLSIQRIRDHLESGLAMGLKNAEVSFMPLAYDLYQKLMPPAKSLKEKLLIIPDGPLTQLPFEVLVTAPSRHFNDASYLVRTKSINYSPSLKVFEINAATTTKEPTEILGYAFTKEVDSLQSLPGTMKEIQTIREVYNKSKVIVRTNDQLTHDRMLSDLELPVGMIHIGLHASSSTRDRLENRIYCGVDNTPVYGFEIAPLHIKAHTIVLTACQSGIGTVVRGEGTYSLARAFKQAGVTNVVGSLWNLSDNITADVVTNFYRGLPVYRSASESLVQAKRQYLASADEFTAHPHFWAALICQGN